MTNNKRNKRIERMREMRKFLSELRERIDDFSFDQIDVIERYLFDLPLEYPSVWTNIFFIDIYPHFGFRD